MLPVLLAEVPWGFISVNQHSVIALTSWCSNVEVPLAWRSTLLASLGQVGSLNIHISVWRRLACGRGASQDPATICGELSTTLILVVIFAWRRSAGNLLIYSRHILVLSASLLGECGRRGVDCALCGEVCIRSVSEVISRYACAARKAQLLTAVARRL